MKTKLLYIEDDTEIATWVRADLEERGYEVVWLGSGEGAAEAAVGCSLIILDVMLPGLDGFTVGQRLKKNIPPCPLSCSRPERPLTISCTVLILPMTM